MNKIIENFLIIIAIVCASPILLFAIFGFYYGLFVFFETNENLLFLVSCMLGFFGYIGLVSLFINKLNKKIKSTLVMLIAGISSFLLLGIIGGITIVDIRRELIYSQAPGLLLLILYPNVIAIIYIIRLSKKLIQNKKKV